MVPFASSGMNRESNTENSIPFMCKVVTLSDYCIQDFARCTLLFTAYTTRLGYEEHIPGQTRDWNDEIQTTRELPRKLLSERLLRERAMFKVQVDRFKFSSNII